MQRDIEMSEDEQNPQINIGKIPVKGGAGAVLVIIALLGVMLYALPELRGPFVIGLGGGLVLAVILIVWHKARG